MLGLDHGSPLLSPLSRVPLAVLVGRVGERALVVDGELQARPAFDLSFTADHRFVDGWHAGRLAAVMRGVLRRSGSRRVAAVAPGPGCTSANLPPPRYTAALPQPAPRRGPPARCGCPKEVVRAVRTYELVMIFRPEMAETEVRSEVSQVEKALVERGAEVKQDRLLGQAPPGLRDQAPQRGLLRRRLVRRAGGRGRRPRPGPGAVGQRPAAQVHPPGMSLGVTPPRHHELRAHRAEF